MAEALGLYAWMTSPNHRTLAHWAGAATQKSGASRAPKVSALCIGLFLANVLTIFEQIFLSSAWSVAQVWAAVRNVSSQARPSSFVAPISQPEGSAGPGRGRPGHRQRFAGGAKMHGCWARCTVDLVQCVSKNLPSRRDVAIAMTERIDSDFPKINAKPVQLCKCNRSALKSQSAHGLGRRALDQGRTDRLTRDASAGVTPSRL